MVVPMTNEELLADLKQFIEATVSQQLADFAAKDDIKGLKTDIAGLKSDIKTLDDKVDLIDQKLDQVQDAVAETVQDHEKRITRLEQQRA